MPCLRNPPGSFSRLKYVFFLFPALVFFLSSCATKRKASKRKPYIQLSESRLKIKYASVLGVDTVHLSNPKLYAFVDEWMYVPYKYAGKDKNGVDCSGFTSMLQADVYHKKISGPSGSIYNACEPVEKSRLTEGELVFFNIDAGKISHVGIYLQNNKFVHASTKRGVIISDLNEPYYLKYYAGGGKLK